MKRSTFYITTILILFAINFSFAQSEDEINEDECTFNSIKLFGKIQLVESFPDLTVQVVESFPDLKVKKIRDAVMEQYGINNSDSEYFVRADTISNFAYSSEDERIQILYHNGELKDVTEASDMLDMKMLTKTVTKNYLCYPKEIDI